MRIVISGLNRKGQEIFYKGYGDELTGKGLGSGALTGTNRVPIFTEDITKAKKIETFIDAKRIMGEIIDAIRYKDIKEVRMISIHFLEEIATHNAIYMQ